ncbi:hypothetical protein PUNSTDRAFT_119920 [Punctularia strigosozonata HHB-11173 SS5]|uniref:uncharacterized protein n=1 Tax=Punctularia strigosozonata (strain HHB-11173) TaxID=741275 RepID=UPI00044164DC|nr:uncharacterized protein PUNSTDRAFT_119920 [Punctularia strigosozonata HHB-11173 SS5]EIN09425.1 hypothetical protein PUNSTDRAFT_119920 [Punctularia strigosozonata HHB-11173 SS5]
MYYYLSFLRTPPVQAQLIDKLTIKPQIANDLRTELYQGIADIYGSWTEDTTDLSIIRFPTKPIKLTTWKGQDSAYKDVVVPLPPGIREGQSWRLILTAFPLVGPGTNVHSPPSTTKTPLHTMGPEIHLNADDTATIFPVASMPTLFTRRNTKSASFGAKQDQIERVLSFSISRAETSDENQLQAEPRQVLRITEQTSFDLDKKLWDSGIGLSSWLVDEANRPDSCRSALSQAAHEVLFGAGVRRFVELGAGTGVVSVVLASLRAAYENLESRIYATDLPSAMPLLEKNIRHNLNCFHADSLTHPHALILDWDDGALPAEVLSDGHIDAIIMADVTYNTDSFPSLIRTLAALVRAGNSHSGPVIVMGYKERDVSERSLWDMAKSIGINFEKIAHKAGCGDPPVEIWIGARTRR